MDTRDLTEAQYWAQRQSGSVLTRERIPKLIAESEWLRVVRPFIEQYEGGRFLELGCSPGHASLAIRGEVRLVPEGVDFSPESEAYLANLRLIDVEAKLHKCDIREFQPERLYDVVGSFGLIEHFDDPEPIFDLHIRLLRPGGLCIVVMPNFRGLQYLYHRLFDRTDLARHNPAIMNLDRISRMLARHDQETLFLGHCGKLRFWNEDSGGGRLARTVRRKVSKRVRKLAGWIGRILPEGLPWAAPWIVYVGRKAGAT